MGLDERRQAPLTRRRRPAGELGGRVEGGDQQDRVGPGRDRPVQLAEIDHELLGDRRQAAGRFAGGEQLVAAEEVVRLDHHRECRGPRRGVGRGLLLGIEAAGERTEARRTHLHFGDDRPPPPRAERGHERIVARDRKRKAAGK